MSFTIVQSASATSSGAATTVSATLTTSSVSTSNIVLAIVSSNVGTQRYAQFALSDNKTGNTYAAQDTGQLVQFGTTGNYVYAQAFVCKPASGGSSFDVTATCTNPLTGSPLSEDLTIAVMEVSYSGPVPQLWSTGIGSGNSSPATVSGAVTHNNSLVLQWALQANVTGTPWTAGAGYTAVENDDYTSGTRNGVLVQYLANTTTSPISPSATLAGISEYATCSWSFSEMPAATTYYVASAGSNSNAGTSSGSPFQTLAHAASVAVFGDTILLNGGDTFAGTGSPFTVGVSIGSYGTGQATVTTSTATVPAIQFNLCSGCTINNVALTGAGNSYTAGSLALAMFENNSLNGYYGFTVTNCNLSAHGYGIWLANQNASYIGTRFGTINLSNNTINNILTDGIVFSGGVATLDYVFINPTINNNSITNITGTFHLETNGIFFSSCYGGICNNNYINGIGINWNNSLAGPGPDGIGFFRSGNCIASNNVVGNVYSTGSTYDGNGLDFDSDTVNCTFINNIVYNCDGPGLLCFTTISNSGNVAAFNLFVDCGLGNAGSIAIENPGSHTIYNNTVRQITATTPALVGLDSYSGTGQKIFNNIFETPTGSTTVNLPATVTDLQGNAYLCGTGFNCTLNGTAYTTLASWRTATGQETSPHGFALSASPFANPGGFGSPTIATFGLAAAYALPVGSSLLGTGLNLSSLYSITPPATDLLSTPITAATLPVGAMVTAPFTVVQTAHNSTTGSSVTATLTTSSVSTSNVVIAIVGAYVSTQQFAAFALSDNKSGNTYIAQDPGQVVERGTAGTYFCVQAFMCKPVAGGSSFAVTAVSSAGSPEICVMEVAYTGPLPQLYSTGQGIGTSSPAAVSNAVTYGPTLLINWCVQGNVSSTPWTVGAGFTAAQNDDFIGGSQFGALVQYFANTTTTPISPSATLAGITEWASVSWSFSEMPAPTTYYVANAGSNSNTGTSSGSPFQTLAHAASVAVFGDTILLNGGDTFPALSSTVGVTISSYGTGQANVTTTAVTTPAIQFSNCSGATVNNLNLSGPNSTYVAGVVGLVEFDNSTSANNAFYNWTATNNTCSNHAAGPTARNTSGNNNQLKAGFINFSGNTITNMNWAGVQTFPGNGNTTTYTFAGVTFDNNNITNIVGTPFLVVNGIYFRACYNGTASNNYINGVGIDWNSSQSTAGPDGIGLFDSAAITANFNVLYNIYSSASFDGNGLDFDQATYNCTFMYNFVSGCDGPGLLCFTTAASSGNVAAFNVFVDNALDHAGAISVENTGSHTVYNNTVVQLTATTPALLVDSSDQSGQTILNNILVTPSGSTTINIPSGGGLVLDGNAYLSGTGFNCTYNSTAYTTLASFRSASSQESPSNGFSLTSNPCLRPSPIPTVTVANFGAAEAYSLIAGSSLLTGGLNVTTGYSITPPAVDIFGTAITAATLPVGAAKAAVYLWSFIQSVTSAAPSTPTATNSVTIGGVTHVTAGHVVVVPIATHAGSVVTSVTDSAGNTYHKAVAKVYPGASNLDTEIWYSVIATGGALTISVALTGADYNSMSAGEYVAPPGSTISVEHTEAATGTGTGVSLTSIPVTTPDVVIMATNLGFGNSFDLPGTPVVGSGWTKRESSADENFAFGGQFYQDLLNPPAAPVVSTMALGASTNWTAVTAAFLATLPPYELLGPASVATGLPATFTLAPTAPVTDTITIASNLAGSFSRTSLTFAASSAGQTFIFTPSAPGLATITLTSSNGFVIGSNPFPLGSYIALTLTGPPNGFVGVPATFTMAPASATTDVATFSDGGAGGAFSAPLTWASSAAAKTFTYTPAAAGTQTITVVSQDGATIAGAPYSLVTVNSVVAPYVSKCGKLAMFLVNGASGASNGAYPLGIISAVNSNPTITVSGSINGTVQLNGPAWFDNPINSYYCVVGYLLQCGGVESIPMSNGGVVTGVLSASWDGVSGGGKNLTLGTPTTAVGITSYTINSPGSGLTNGAFDYSGLAASSFPGTPSGVAATARITVSGGQVTSCVPRSGSPIAYGGGYSSSPTVTVIPAEDGVGTGASITLNHNTYVTGVPVLTPGSGFTSPPTITVAGATSAACVPIMTGPLSTDTVTYSWAAGGLTTQFGTTAAATNAAMVNSVGALEGPAGHSPGFNVTPAFGFGIFPTPAAEPQTNVLFGAANKFLCNSGWVEGSGTTALTVDPVTAYPVSWTPAGQIYCDIQMQTYGGTACAPVGTWTLVYDDEFYAPASTIPAATTVSLAWTANGNNFTATPGSPTRSGTTITQTYSVALTSASSYNMNIRFLATAPSDGLWHLSNPGVFPPGTAVDRTPFAVDQNWVTVDTGSGGTVPYAIRMMASQGAPSGHNFMVDVSDMPPTTLNSYNLWYVNFPPNSPPNQPGGVTSGTVSIAAVRFFNTNPAKSSTGDNTYPWPASTKIYSTQPWANSGSDSFGDYLSTTTGPLGVNDNGQILCVNVGSPGVNEQAIAEFRTSSPHGLKTGQWVVFQGTAAIPWDQGFGTVNVPTGNLSAYFQACLVGVTGADTFVAQLLGEGGNGIGGPPATNFLKVNSTSEIPVTGFTATLKCPLGNGWFPYESMYKYVAAHPGAYCWLNIPPTASHALVQYITNLAVTYLGPTNGLIVEWGNEHWNTTGTAGFEHFWEVIAANFCQYAPSGQPFLTYAKGGDSTGVAGNDVSYTLMAADAYAVAKAAWIAGGRSASDFYEVYGGQTHGPGASATATATIATYSIPTTNIFQSMAYYEGIDFNQLTLTKAFSSAGDVGVSSPGNWPADAILDFMRFHFFNKQYNFDNWQGQYDVLAPGARICCYEGCFTSILDSDNISMGNYLEEDMYNHPGWYDLIWTYAVALQRGNPAQAGAAPVFITYSGTWETGDSVNASGSQSSSIDNAQIGGDFVYHLAQSVYMPTGRGLTNKFFTPQGGVSGADASHPTGYGQTNQAPGIQALVDWNAASGVPGPPMVVSSSPAGGATAVSVGATINLTFSQAMNAATITSGTFTVAAAGSNIAGSIAYNAGTFVATFTPTVLLAYSTTYTVTASTGIQNPAGTPLASIDVVMFSTAAQVAPTVTAVTPASGATSVAIATTVTVTFSEVMNAASVTTANVTVGTGSPVAASIAYNTGTFVATLTPSSPLAYSTTYTITGTTALESGGGTFLAGTYTSTFTTLAAPALSVASTVPAASATGVSLTPNITIVFNLPLNAPTANKLTILLAQGATPIAGTVSYNPATLTATFMPSVVLAASTVYTLTITTAVESAGGAFLGSPYTSSFTTGAAVTPSTRPSRRWFPGLRFPSY